MILSRIAYYTDLPNNIHGSESLPADASTWATNWEKHSFTPTIKL